MFLKGRLPTPLRVHLIGDVPMQYVPFAQGKLRKLHKEAQGGSRTKHYRLARGCVVTISVVGDDGYIKIKCGGCPKLLHGLMDPVVDGAHPDALYDDIIEGETVETFHRFYERDATAWANVTSLKTAGPQSLTKRPGLYSGLMRKVVQALLGTNQQVQYDYTFAKTHGIYTDALGRYHVIEISSAGVYSWPLPACTASESVTGLTVTPLYQSLAAGRPSNALQLADASEVAGAYGKTPIFSACGWAFSYSGHSASNVVLSESGGYYVSHLYTITITENENGPTNATIAEIESDTLWGDKVTHLKYPDYTEATIASFDWTNGQVSEPGSDDTAPVYCWYDDDALIVCRFVRVRNAAFSNTSDSIEYYLGGASAIPIPGGHYENISGTQETRSFSITTHVSAVASRTYTGAESDAIQLDSWSDVYAFGTFNTNKSYTHAIAAGARNRTSVSLTEEYIEALVIAYGDREAVFHARQYNKDGTADEEVTQVGFYGYGSKWGTEADPTNGGSHTWTTEIAAGDITPPAGADSSVRAHNQINEIGDGPDVGGIGSNLTFYQIYEHVGYFYGRSGTPEEIGALAYATTANEDEYGGDPCFTGTTRIDADGYAQFNLENFQSYVSFSVTPPCGGPAESAGIEVHEVDQYWFGNGQSIAASSYEQSSTPVTITEATKEAVLIRNSGSTTIDAGAADFTTTWCEFLDTTDEYQMMLSLPDCSGGGKDAYLNGIDLEYATFPDDMLGGGTYPVTELTNLHACFIGNP